MIGTILCLDGSSMVDLFFGGVLGGFSNFPSLNCLEECYQLASSVNIM